MNKITSHWTWKHIVIFVTVCLVTYLIRTELLGLIHNIFNSEVFVSGVSGGLVVVICAFLNKENK